APLRASPRRPARSGGRRCCTGRCRGRSPTPCHVVVIGSWMRCRDRNAFLNPGALDVKTDQAGFKIRTARGGGGSPNACGCPCHGVGSVQAPPALPRLLPPYSLASLLSSSR